MVGLSLLDKKARDATAARIDEGLQNQGQGWQASRIDFVPSVSSDTASAASALRGIDFLLLDAGAAARLPLGSQSPSGMRGSAGKQQQQLAAAAAAAPDDQDEPLQMRWTSVRRTGAGLVNLGNTCFMNSVLQCLIHTPPLAERCLSGARLGSDDLIRNTQELVVRSLGGRARSMPPTAHARSLRVVSKSFRPGRQEDAHEYLMGLLDALHERSLKKGSNSRGSNKPPPPGEKKLSATFFGRVFGGRLCSQIKCLESGFESNTFEDCLDLSLEVSHANSVQRALQRFTAAEILEGSNKYKHPETGKYVRASKRMCIDAAPNVLTLQLKRFEFGGFGRKVNKKVDFGTQLDLAPFMRAARKGASYQYDLYAVLVHAGNSVRSGHYYCFVKGPAGIWHEMDDSMVTEVSEKRVLAQRAYILFYVRRVPGNVVRAAIPAPAPAVAKKEMPAAAAPPQAALPAAAKLAPIKTQAPAKAPRSTSTSPPAPESPPAKLQIPLHRTVTLPCSPRRSVSPRKLALVQRMAPLGRQPAASSGRLLRLQKLQSDITTMWCLKRLRKRQRLAAASRAGGVATPSPGAKRPRDFTSDIRSPIATRAKHQRLVQAAH